MAKPFLYIYNYFAVNRKIFFVVFVGLFLLTGFFALKIKPEEDISKILPKDQQSEKLNELFQNARFADKLVVMVSMKDSNRKSPELLAAFSDSFAYRLQRLYPDFITAVDERINDSLIPELTGLMIDHLPVFLEPEDYSSFDSLVNPEQIKTILSRDIKTLSSPAGFVMKSIISRDPVGLTSAAFKKIRQLQFDENFELYDGHIMTKDEHYMLLFVNPAYTADNTGKNSRLLKGMDEIIEGLQGNDFKTIDANYFGGTAVAVGNASQLRSDSILTISTTVLFLILFISWYFKKKRAPFLILLPVLLGAFRYSPCSRFHRARHCHKLFPACI
jgi:uncharacterized protein